MSVSILVLYLDYIPNRGHCLSGKPFQFWRMAFLVRIFMFGRVFFFSQHFLHIWASPLWPEGCFFVENSAYSLTGIPPSCYPLVSFKIFTLSLTFDNFTIACLYVILFGFIFFGTFWAFWIRMSVSFPRRGNFQLLLLWVSTPPFSLYFLLLGHL